MFPSEPQHSHQRSLAPPDCNTGFSATGHLTFDTYNNITAQYAYNVHHNNLNDRTLAGLSQQSDQKMRPCATCELYPDFLHYFQFYGKADFAHRWIMAAFTGTRTVFESSAVDFTEYSLESRAGACFCCHVHFFP
jgi:hypothetical protein